MSYGMPTQAWDMAPSYYPLSNPQTEYFYPKSPNNNLRVPFFANSEDNDE